MSNEHLESLFETLCKQEHGLTKYIYRNKKDAQYIRTALTVAVSEKKIVMYFEFYSSSFGVARWNPENRLYGNIWESEEKARSVSQLSKHYTSVFMNGSAGSSDLLKIKNHVLDSVPNPLKLKIESIMSSDSSEVYWNESF